MFVTVCLFFHLQQRENQNKLHPNHNKKPLSPCFSLLVRTHIAAPTCPQPGSLKSQGFSPGFLSQCEPAFLGMSENPRGHFWLPQRRGSTTGICGESQGCTVHPAALRAALQEEKRPAQNATVPLGRQWCLSSHLVSSWGLWVVAKFLRVTHGLSVWSPLLVTLRQSRGEFLRPILHSPDSTTCLFALIPATHLWRDHISSLSQ